MKTSHFNNTIIWLQISAGRCPAECQWVVAKLTNYIIDDCQKHKLDVELLESVKGDQAKTYKSSLLRIAGDNINQLFIQGGTVLWHGESPFRPRHKRKNWYVSIESLNINTSLNNNQNIENEVKIETFKSSGKGGQNVNKRDTAVRITHLPTKLAVVGREERTQLMNKKLAMARLKSKLAVIGQTNLDNNDKERWKQHDSLERGNPIMRFKGYDFKAY